MKYNINNNNLHEIYSSIENELEKNREVIKELLEIDSKYSKMKVDIESLKNILNRLKSEKITLQKEQKIEIKYNGNPYITLNLSILAILTKTTIILDYGQNMLGINNFIVETINNILNDLNTEKIIYKVEQVKENIDKIICIDEINEYNKYLREKTKKTEFYSLNYIDLYYDSEEFEDLTELIYKYAEEEQIPIETYSELETNEAIQMLKNGLGRNVVLLTNKNEIKQLFKDSMKDKNLYINKNPFNQEIRLISKEIFL